jgi:hypothetical protein
MRVITKDHLVTNLRWWDQLHVDGTKVVLERVAKEEEEIEGVIFEIADTKDEAEAQELFKVLNEGIRLQKQSFDINTWDGEHFTATNE